MATARCQALVLFLGILLLGQFLSIPQVSAVEFVIVGPRAMGMGGAGVATTTDSLATYWNPAGLALKRSVDIRIHGSVQGVDRLGVREIIGDIKDIPRTASSLADLAILQVRLDALLAKLNVPGASLSALAAGGLYFKGYAGDSAFGLNISDVATGGLFVPTPLSTSTSGLDLNIDGEFLANVLEARQVALSYAHLFMDETLAIGVTGKIIQGVAYSSSIDVRSADEGFNFGDELKKSESSTDFGVDVGAIVRPSSWLRLAVVGKDLNAPSFKAPSGDKLKLARQVRAGVAVNPYESLTLAFDADLTKNKTLVPTIKSRVLSLGAEQTIYHEFISLRVGALKNVEDAKSIVTPTAGIGIRFFALRFDAGGGFDFDEGQALASFSLSLTF